MGDHAAEGGKPSPAQNPNQPRRWQAWTSSETDKDFELLEQYLSSLKPEETILVRQHTARRGVGRAHGVVERWRASTCTGMLPKHCPGAPHTLRTHTHAQKKRAHTQTHRNPPLQVASSFSHMLNLHNLTEEVNSSQTERAVRLGEVRGNQAKCPGLALPFWGLQALQQASRDPHGCPPHPALPRWRTPCAPPTSHCSS